MIFLTEEDVRQRCELGQGGEFRLQAGERLTPGGHGAVAQSQLPRDPPWSSAPWKRRLSKKPNPRLPAAEAAPAAPAAEQASFPDGTYLDANTVVSKSHPRIFLRGKLDTLISSTVLVQTGFDGNNKLPAVLRNGLSDINVWLWQILQAEVSGEAVPAQSLCGMNAEAIRLVSHDPMKYLGQGHIVPDVALGPNVALLNWLRAQAREVEVAYVQVGMEREDILASLNRLSSAIYVLMLLTVVAESGRDISKVGL